MEQDLKLGRAESTNICLQNVSLHLCIQLTSCKEHAMFAYTLYVLLACKHSFCELQLAKGNKFFLKIRLIFYVFPFLSVTLLFLSQVHCSC